MEEACRKVNKEGTENIAQVCEALDIPIMYFQPIMCLTDKAVSLGRNMMRKLL